MKKSKITNELVRLLKIEKNAEGYFESDISGVTYTNKEDAIYFIVRDLLKYKEKLKWLRQVLNNLSLESII